MGRGNRRIQYLITAAVCTTAITSGVVFSWTAPIIPKFHNRETSFLLTETELSWMVSISSIGYMIGSLMSRFTSDKFGRRANLLGSVIPFGIGLAFKIFAFNVWTICCGRMLFGFAAGMISTVSTIYLAEISDKDIRGRLILGHRFMFSFGSLLTMSIGSFVSYDTLNYCIIAVPPTYFSAIWFIPESPYFLLKGERVDDARKSLALISNLKDDKLEERLSQLRSDVRKEMSRAGSYKEFFTGAQYRKSIIIVLGLKLAQLMSGLHAVQQYLGLIIQESKVNMELSTGLIIFGVVRFVVGIMSSLLVDRVGRRPLLICSFFGAAACLSTVGVYFYIHTDQQTASPFAFVPFVGIILAIITSVLGFESVAYAMPSELFPINVKAVATTSVYIYGGLINFTSVKTYQPLKGLGGLHYVFALYATASFFGALFSIFVVPETKCKSLKQIQIELQGNNFYEDDEVQVPLKNTKTQVTEETDLNNVDRK